MSAPRPSGGRALVRQRVGGLVFLAVLVGLIGLSIAFYEKAFTDVVEVTLEADRAGNQLTAPTDVKVNGVIVGEAREIEAADDGARITLALEPAAARTIPANVQARLLPKTLFGEKYVDLVLPDQPQGRLQAGSVIPQDRSQTARETETALNDLLPLLQTLKPEVVSTTLNAVSSAVRGRGDRIGSNLQLTRDYLAQLNPSLPTLQEDLRGTADFADTLDQAAPDLLSFLDDISAVNRNLVAEQQQLDAFLTATTGVSGTLESFVRDNERRFVDLAAQGRAPLEVFAKYAPQYPCLADGLAQSNRFIGDAFGGQQPGLHITLELTKDQGGYQPQSDEPQYLDDRGPDCFGLPRPPVPAADFDFRDGYRDGQPTTQSQASSGGVAPASYSSAVASRRLIDAAVAPALGVDADAVPAVARLLSAPLLSSARSAS